MRICFLLTATAVVSASLAAHADTFNFSFGASSNPFSGSGTLTTGVMEAPGEYLITSVTGTVATSAGGANMMIQSILAPGVFPTPTNGGSFPANDDILFVTNNIGSLSQYGLSFILKGGAQINLYNDGPGADALLERVNGNLVSESVPVTITLAASTPEPSTFVLLGTGLLGVAGVMRRRPA